MEIRSPTILKSKTVPEFINYCLLPTYLYNASGGWRLWFSWTAKPKA